MNSIQFKSYSIRKLISIVEEKRFAVPELQREFVWDTKRACKLLDSIYKGLPIGTLMVWDTNASHRDLLRHSLHILPPFDHNNDKIWFLIDGQQRLSVLYQVQRGDKIVNAGGKKIDFANVYFHLTGDHDSLFSYRKHVDSNDYARVTDILAHNWRAKFRSWPKGKLQRIEQCRSLLRDYTVPVTLLSTSSLEEVRESFLRINSLGMKISSADRAFARATSLNLRQLLHEARHNWVNKGYDRLPDATILMALAVLNGKTDLGQRAIDAYVKHLDRSINNGGDRKPFTRQWDRLKDCLGQAIDYLDTNFGVVNYGFLPSDNILMALALFFYYNNKARPNTAQRRELRKWFWATAATQRYSGRGYYQNIGKDLKFFKSLGTKRSGTFRLSQRMPVSQIRRCEFTQKSAMTSAFFCLLAKHRPRYLENGDFIPLANYAARSNRENKHHIFPKKQLSKNGFDAVQFNTICNICFIVAKENQSIGGDEPPRLYLKKFKHKRHFAGVMKSHLIPYRMDSGLWLSNIKKGFKQFRLRRMELIRREFEKEAGIRLFQKD